MCWTVGTAKYHWQVLIVVVRSRPVYYVASATVISTLLTVRVRRAPDVPEVQ